jgi:hypothetical protein
MPLNIVFQKTGKEIKTAIQNRRQQLEARLAVRNQALNEFMQNSKKVRSYLIRHSDVISTMYTRGHGGRGYVLYSKDDISSEEMQEVAQLCQRIAEIEQELHRLSLIAHHLSDEQVFELNFEDLIGYGFEASLEGSY